MISQSDETGYIHEPFSLVSRPGLCSLNLEYWFTYICDENGNKYFEELKKCLSFNYSLKRDFKNFISLKSLYYSFRDYYRFNLYNIGQRRPLVKDPIALFSAEWLAKTFDMDVVVVIRHPAAFAGSLKKVNWLHPFDHFLKQPLLIKQIPENYVSLMEKYLNSNPGIIDQATLLWNVIHHRIIQYKKLYPNWIFVRHEDISRQPIEAFKEIYERLNLNFTDKIEQKIKSFSFSKNSGVINRDSKANIFSWKKRLTDMEIDTIHSNTNTISKEFYSDSEW